MKDVFEIIEGDNTEEITDVEQITRYFANECQTVVEHCQNDDNKMLFVAAITEDQDGLYHFVYSRNTTTFLSMGLLSQLLIDMGNGGE